MDKVQLLQYVGGGAPYNKYYKIKNDIKFDEIRVYLNNQIRSYDKSKLKNRRSFVDKITNFITNVENLFNMFIKPENQLFVDIKSFYKKKNIKGYLNEKPYIDFITNQYKEEVLTIFSIMLYDKSNTDKFDLPQKTQIIDLIDQYINKMLSIQEDTNISRNISRNISSNVLKIINKYNFNMTKALHNIYIKLLNSKKQGTDIFFKSREFISKLYFFRKIKTQILYINSLRYVLISDSKDEQSKKYLHDIFNNIYIKFKKIKITEEEIEFTKLQDIQKTMDKEIARINKGLKLEEITLEENSEDKIPVAAEATEATLGADMINDELSNIINHVKPDFKDVIDDYINLHEELEKETKTELKLSKLEKFVGKHYNTIQDKMLFTTSQYTEKLETTTMSDDRESVNSGTSGSSSSSNASSVVSKILEIVDNDTKKPGQVINRI